MLILFQVQKSKFTDSEDKGRFAHVIKSVADNQAVINPNFLDENKILHIF